MGGLDYGLSHDDGNHEVPGENGSFFQQQYNGFRRRQEQNGDASTDVETTMLHPDMTVTSTAATDRHSAATFEAAGMRRTTAAAGVV